MSEGPASLYQGKVMHARLGDVAHRFTYRVLGMLVDLKELDACGRMSRLFSIDRFNLLSIHQRDHAIGETHGAETLAEKIAATAAAHGADASGSIRMLTFPRVMGGVFNPLTVFFVSADNGALSAVVYEVRNTFGAMHHYVCPVEPCQVSRAGIRQSVGKSFFVSPFMGMEQRYDFRLRPPADTATVRILQHGPDGPSLAATFFGERRPLTDRNIVEALLATGMCAPKVLAGIHYEAARLYWKGARFHPIPDTAKRAFSTSGATGSTPHATRSHRQN